MSSTFFFFYYLLNTAHVNFLIKKMRRRGRQNILNPLYIKYICKFVHWVISVPGEEGGWFFSMIYARGPPLIISSAHRICAQLEKKYASKFKERQRRRRRRRARDCARNIKACVCVRAQECTRNKICFRYIWRKIKSCLFHNHMKQSSPGIIYKVHICTHKYVYT